MCPEDITEKMDHASNSTGCATSAEPGDLDSSSRALYPYDQPHEDVNPKDRSEPTDQQTSATQNEPHRKNYEEDKENRRRDHAAIMTGKRP